MNDTNAVTRNEQASRTDAATRADARAQRGAARRP